MTKEELVGLTIQKLIDRFKDSPESFEYTDHELKPGTSGPPTVYWQPKIQLGDYMSTVVDDPNNDHAVIVTFNPNYNEIICYIFLKAPMNLLTVNTALADCTISSKRPFEKWRGNYRKFIRLRNLIIAKDRHKVNLNYLKKLSSVFPDVNDDALLK